MTQDPYRYFRIEARELMDQIAEGVLEAESRAQRPEAVPVPTNLELVARLLRLAHTLKGAARVVRQPEIADQTHTMEDVLESYREGAKPFASDHIAGLLTLVDGINERLTTLDSAPALPTQPGAATPPSDAPPSVAPGASADIRPSASPRESLPTLRADTADVDEVLDTIGEAHAQLTPLRRGMRTLERACQGAELLAEQLAGPEFRSQTIGRGERNDSARDRVRSIATDLTAELATLHRGLTRSVEQTARELQQVRNSAERLRLVAAGSVFIALHRAVRDVADAQGKLVHFEGRGGDVRLDPRVLTEVHNALLHTVRNAVAHGIESQQDRREAGKSTTGSVVVEVVRRGSRVIFSCRDDGLGFDLDSVRRAARAKGLIPADAAAGGSGEQELMKLLLRGGITTSSTVTEVSGRGVGLDAVRDVAERLGGEVMISTDPGRGATVEVAVPLSLMSIDGLVIGGLGGTTTIPLDSVRHSMRLRPGQIANTASGATVIHEGRAIPYLSLSSALASQASRSASDPTAPPPIGIIVAGGSRTAVIGVERLLGTDVVVVRPMTELAPTSQVVGGMSLDGEGNPRLVLDPEGLVAVAHSGALWSGAGTELAEQTKTQLPVLVVDDSLTTRMLEQSILESAGYTVHVAGSGEEALDKAHSARYALFLVDIEMPGIDGFTFIERTRADPALRDIPAILVSSRASPEDRARGLQVGARMHVEKSQFNQNELLERIGKLVG